jgi:RNA polymerase sigma-70 factor (ECF subfamily)
MLPGMKTFNRLYHEHRKKLFYYLMRRSGDYELSRDIMQESFTRFYKHYRNSRADVSLVYTIARNALIDHYRKNRHNTQFDENSAGGTLESERYLLVRDKYRRTLSAIEKLNPDERDILSLMTSTGFSYRRIAEIVQMSEANVKVKIHRARLHLKKLLGEENHER